MHTYNLSLHTRAYIQYSLLHFSLIVLSHAGYAFNPSTTTPARNTRIRKSCAASNKLTKESYFRDYRLHTTRHAMRRHVNPRTTGACLVPTDVENIYRLLNSRIYD